MNKIIKRATEIFKAWQIVFDPNDQQAELAAARIAICDGCEFKSDVPIKHCSVCGCALKGKIFTQNKDACPKGKWNSIEAEILG